MSLDNGADATQIFVKGREGFCLMGYRLSRVRLRGLQPSHSVCSVPHAVPVLIPLHPPEKPFCNLVGRFPSGCPYMVLCWFQLGSTALRLWRASFWFWLFQ